MAAPSFSHPNVLTADRANQAWMDYEERLSMWWKRYKRYPRDYAYYYSSQMQRKCCILHRINYRNVCKQCETLRKNKTMDETRTHMSVRRFRNKLYREADFRKHTDESCSSCDRKISAEDWFCYCSLCPECYMQIPDEELDKIDRQIEQLALGKRE